MSRPLHPDPLPDAGANPRRTAPRRTGAARAAAALAALSRLAMTPVEQLDAGTLVQACTLIGAILDAEEAYVVRSGDPHFVRVDAPADPGAYEIKQKGYFLVWRQLATNPQLVGGQFTVAERLVAAPDVLRRDTPATHLAMLLPSDESSSELLIVRGPWPHGLSRGQLDFITAARPMLAYLVGGLLDARRRDRQREQLQSLGAVASALARGQEVETALPAIATAVAKASGFDWATITLVDEAIERVTARAINSARHSDTTTATLSREGTVNLREALSSARAFRRSREPQVYSNVLGDDEPRTEMQRFLERAHLLSTGTFPLYSGDRLLGTLNFSDSTVRAFDAPEVEFLSLLTDQVVRAIEWLQLNQELREANAALARMATHDVLTG
ncbi:MAG TPA: GAF domain-containing protein, partial [Dehalococcoidia bacterium]|nr:GAF domain-containing protein [Dehalococcoidia bacterium]